MPAQLVRVGRLSYYRDACERRSILSSYFARSSYPCTVCVREPGQTKGGIRLHIAYEIRTAQRHRLFWGMR